MYQRFQLIGRAAGLGNVGFRDQEGFTLLEVLIVILLFSALVGVTTVVSMDSYRSYNFQTQQTQFRALVLQARSQAVSNIHQAPHGVRVNQVPLQYVLFEGVDYAHRDAAQDVLVTPSSTLTVGGLTEVVFTQLTGQPNVIGSFTLNDGIHPPSSISINNEGQVNLH